MYNRRTAWTRRFCFLLLAIPAGLRAQAPAANSPYFTETQGNGRWWNKMDDNARLTYIVGYHDRNIGKETAGSPFPNGVPFADTIKAVTQFFESPENLGIPIADAITVFAWKLRGIPADQIDSYIALSRRLSLRK